MHSRFYSLKPWVALVLGATVGSAAGAAPASAPTGNLPLLNTHWTLASLDGSAAVANGARALPHLVLHAAPQRLSGFAGCNRLGGRYTKRGIQLALTALPGSNATCTPALMQQEQHYVQALAAADSYRIEGQVLSLLQGDVVKATFTAHRGR